MKQPTPKPGQMRLWSYQSLAHGADYISYFRWRTCWIGTEIYWHGLNNYSNEPGRRMKELEQVSEEFKGLKEIAGANYVAKIALIRDYDNIWDGEQDKWHGPLDDFSDNGWFTATQLTHTPMDFLYLQNGTKKTSIDDLCRYDMLVYAHATILTEETAELLKEYVSLGGTLIMGARTGYKDEFGRCPMHAMPGFASGICGVKVEDFTHLSPGDEEEYADWDGELMEAPVFNDILTPIGNGKVLATFKGNYYDGEPALVMNEVGLGKAYYFGAGFSVQTATTFLKRFGYSEPLNHVIHLPKEVEVSVRRKDDMDYIFVLNYMAHDISLTLHTSMVDMISGNEASGDVTLEKYGVAIYRYKRLKSLPNL